MPAITDTSLSIADVHFCVTYAGNNAIIADFCSQRLDPLPILDTWIQLERMRPISSTSLAVIEQLRKRILSGELRPGLPLRQENLAADMGVSRLPIRDALSRLEAEGLIEIRPNRGACVAMLGRSECVEIFDLRVMLEGDVLAHAIPHHTPRSIRGIQSIQAELEVEQETSHWIEGDRRFHEELCKPSGRHWTLQIIKTLRNAVERFCFLNLYHDIRRVEWKDEHRELLKAVVARDIARARKCLTSHLRATQEVVLAAVDRKPDEG